MSSNAIALKQIMADIFECDIHDVTPDSSINQTVGWDSLSHISLMLELGKHGASVTPLQIPELTTYAAIRAHVEAAGKPVND